MSVENCYIYNTLVIEYISKSNKMCKVTTDIDIKKKKRYNNTSDDFEKIQKPKIIFEEKNWTRDSYQKKYERKLRYIYDIDVITKIYKKKCLSLSY